MAVWLVCDTSNIYAEAKTVQSVKSAVQSTKRKFPPKMNGRMDKMDFKLPIRQHPRGKNFSMKRYIPFALTTLRLLLGPLALLCVSAQVSRWVYLPILVLATWSDIYDGILARRYGVSTAAFRRYDSSTDLIFYLFILLTAWRLCHDVLQRTWWAIAAVLVTEALLIAISFWRFGKYPAAHSCLAKCFGLCLLACLIALLTFNAGAWAVYTIGVVGVATNVEIIIIHLLARSAPVDVRSIAALIKEKKAARRTAL